MRTPFFLLASLVGLCTITTAQETASLLPAPPPTYVGTYSLASGTLTAGAPEGPATCGIGVIYNNSAPDPTLGQLGYFHDATAGNTILDEGRIPSISGGGPADNYEVQGFTLGFSTNRTRVNLQISFWKDGDTCDTLAMLGTPTAQYNITRIHGSPVAGQQASVLVDIDLCDQPFTICGDSNAIFGDGDWDKFVWGFKVLSQDPNLGDRTGPLVAGDPQGCNDGIGLFGPLGGFGTYPAMGCDSVVEGNATGLRTVDSFGRGDDGPNSPGCFWFGGYPANPFGSFYMKLRSSSVNDRCETASELRASLGQGVVSCNTCCSNSNDPGCQGFTSPSLWYTWVAPTAGTYIFDTCGSNYDTAISVYSGTCGNLVCEAANDDACGLQSRVSVPLAALQVVYIQLQGFGSSECGEMTLNINPDPCNSITDDVYGDNDVCTDATVVGNGNFVDHSFSGDADWYTSVVCRGETLTYDLQFTHGMGDIDIFLFDASGAGCPGLLLSSSTSTSNSEQVSYLNNTGSMQQLYLLVVNLNSTCNQYTLLVDGDCRVGTTYCNSPPQMQNPNSTTLVASLSVYGSVSVSADDLNLVATQMPTGEFGYFIWSINPGFVDLPAASISDGFYCLGSGSGRFNGNNGGPGAVLATGTSGSFSLLNIDTTNMPQSSLAGNLAIFQSLQGNFQAWYRDSLGTFGNNFTDAVSLVWTLP